MTEDKKGAESDSAPKNKSITEALDYLVDTILEANSKGNKFRYSSDKDSFRESVSRMRRIFDDPKTSKEKKDKIALWMKGAKKHKKKGFKKDVNESVTKDDLEKVKEGTVLQLGKFNKFVVNGKGKSWFTGSLQDMKGKEVSVDSTVSFGNFSNPHYNKNISIISESGDLNESKKENIKLVVIKGHTLGYSTKREGRYGILHASILKGAPSNYGNSISSLDVKDKDVRLATEKDFEDFKVSMDGYKKKNKYSNTNYIWDGGSTDSTNESVELNESSNETKVVYESDSMNAVVVSNKYAARLVSTWIGYSNTSEIDGNKPALRILPNLTKLMVSASKNRDNKEIYKLLSNTFLKGKFFQEDRDIVDREMKSYIKYKLKK